MAPGASLAAPQRCPGGKRWIAPEPFSNDGKRTIAPRDHRHGSGAGTHHYRSVDDHHSSASVRSACASPDEGGQPDHPPPQLGSARPPGGRARSDDDGRRRIRKGRRLFPGDRDQHRVPRRAGDCRRRRPVPAPEPAAAGDHRRRQVWPRHPLRVRGDGTASDRRVPADRGPVHPDRGPGRRARRPTGAARRSGRRLALSPPGLSRHPGQLEPRRPARHRPWRHGDPPLHRHTPVDLGAHRHGPSPRGLPGPRSPALAPGRGGRERRSASGDDRSRACDARANRGPASRRSRV